MKKWRQDEWRQVSTWFDEVMTLEPDQRQAWLVRLQTEDESRQPLIEELTRMLLAAGEVETSHFLAAPPRLEAPIATDFFAGQIIGPYRLESQLGCGGMAEVWRASRADGQWQREVALKLPFLAQQPAGQRSAWTRRFQRERDILAALRHPNIAALLDADINDEGVAWLALEYVRGEPITSHCDWQALGLHERLQLFRQVLLAVQHAHAHLVIHRDLKPANILVTENGEVRLLDFGIAKLLVGDQESTQATELTLLAGRPLTPAYASPEQVLGRPLTTASDIYSLGVLFYELVCGLIPYELHHTSTVELERAIIEVDPRLPSRREMDSEHASRRQTTLRALRAQLAPELDAIALRALEKSPEARYPSADAMRADIDRWLNGEPVLARPPTRWLLLRKFVSRHRVGVAAGSTAVLALVALTTVAVVQRGQAQHEAARAVASRDFLLEMFRLADPDQTRGANLTARELLEAGRKRAIDSLEEQPQLQAELLAAIGNVQKETGQMDRADATLAQAVDILRRQGNARQLVLTEIATAENARVMLDARRAEQLLRRAESDAAAFSDDHEIQAKLLAVRGWLFVESGDLEGAARVLEKSLNEATARWGVDDEQTIAALARLADVQGRRRQYEVALASLEEAFRRADNNPKISAWRRADLEGYRVYAALDAGKYAVARDQAARAVTRCHADLGVTGPLCRSLQRLQLVAALRLGYVDEAAAIATDLLPELASHSAPARQLRLLIVVGRAFAAAGQLPRFPLVRQRLQAGASPDDANLPPLLRLQARQALAEIALREGRPQAALQIVNEALAGEDSQSTRVDLQARGRMLAGLALQARGRHAEALELFATASHLYEQALDSHHPDTLLCGLNRIESLSALGRVEEATALIDASLPQLRQAIGSAAPIIKRIERWRADLAAARPIDFHTAGGRDFFS
jgi:serine/threonine protein kinase